MPPLARPAERQQCDLIGRFAVLVSCGHGHRPPRFALFFYQAFSLAQGIQSAPTTFAGCAGCGNFMTGSRWNVEGRKASFARMGCAWCELVRGMGKGKGKTCGRREGRGAWLSHVSSTCTSDGFSLAWPSLASSWDREERGFWGGRDALR